MHLIGADTPCPTPHRGVGGAWGGEWLVLLHGLASQAHIWDLVAPLLIDSFRVIAIDQRGHGLSDKPDSGYDWATVTADLDAILNALNASPIGRCWPAIRGAATSPCNMPSIIPIA